MNSQELPLQCKEERTDDQTNARMNEETNKIICRNTIKISSKTQEP
jgi:hypothetical protein